MSWHPARSFSSAEPVPVPCPMSCGGGELRACPYFWKRGMDLRRATGAAGRGDWIRSDPELEKSNRWDRGMNCCINLAVLPLPGRELTMAVVS